MGVELILGDALEVARGLPDESFTACFCDPPYGLKFMGKEWDHGVPSTEVWAEVWRVLAPGAVLMAFGGTRTWHRLAVAIEDAGFELFDTMMWLYGSGFPKSASISKHIDKAAGAKRTELRHDFSDLFGDHTQTVRDNRWNEPSGIVNVGQGERTRVSRSLGAPATDAAKTWEGYGTALKPAWEPILLARKPRRATYAQTAMEHGTGALNIDGCRVATDWLQERGETWLRSGKQQMPYEWQGPPSTKAGSTCADRVSAKGRWPANLLLSHSDCERVGVKRVKGAPHLGQKNPELTKQYGGGSFGGGKVSPGSGYADPDGLETVAAYRCSPDCPVAMLDRQGGASKPSWRQPQPDRAYPDGIFPKPAINRGARGHTDSGGSSRFFQTFERFYYCPKASRKERDMGLEGMPAQDALYRGNLVCRKCGHQKISGSPCQCNEPDYEYKPLKPQRNPHPTVKPLALCEYLARLIVPPEEYRDEAQLLVPFCGTASEIIGALKAGWRNVVGIDIIPEYLEIASLRIAAWGAEPKQAEMGLGVD